jgi:cation transport ATPase
MWSPSSDTLGLDELMRLAASVKCSEHLLGEAIVEEARSRSMRISDPKGFEAITGKGVSAC